MITIYTHTPIIGNTIIVSDPFAPSIPPLPPISVPEPVKPKKKRTGGIPESILHDYVEAYNREYQEIEEWSQLLELADIASKKVDNLHHYKPPVKADISKKEDDSGLSLLGTTTDNSDEKSKTIVSFGIGILVGAALVCLITQS